MLNEELTQETLNDGWEEEWEIVMNTGAKYTLSKKQSWVVKAEIAAGNRGIIMFKTFSISLPYVAEFYLVRRYKSDQFALPARAMEEAWTEEDRQHAIKRIAEIKEKILKRK